MKYTWGAIIFRADANKVGKELNDIENISNKKVLEYAKNNPNSELHKCFTWDNEVAGELFRLEQATNIMCSISISYEKNNEEKRTRVYVKTKSDEEGKRTFKKLIDVLEDDEEYKKLCDDAKADINRTQEKYREIIRLQDLKDIIFDIYKSI